jgi:ASC-1-like (ASCH) protein
MATQKQLQHVHHTNLGLGTKKCEGRCMSDFWCEKLVGTDILWMDKGDGEVINPPLLMKITGMRMYVGVDLVDATRKMLEGEGVENMLPGLTLEEGVLLYTKIYKNELEKKVMISFDCKMI